VRGRAAAVEQAGGAVDERACADRCRQLDLACAVAHPAADSIVLCEPARSSAAGDDEQIEWRERSEVVIGDAAQTAHGDDRLGRFSDQHDAGQRWVIAPARLINAPHRKDLERPPEVNDLEIGAEFAGPR
jgi:hypothetical protein